MTALTSQTEMLRAQVSGKSPSFRADAGSFTRPRASPAGEGEMTLARVPIPTLPRGEVSLAQMACTGLPPGQQCWGEQ